MTHLSGTERAVSGGERRRLAMLLSHTLQDLEKEIAGHSRRLEIVGRFHSTSGSAASKAAMLEARALRDRAIADLWAVHDVARHSNEGRIAPPRGLSKQTLIAFARKAAHKLPRREYGGSTGTDNSETGNDAAAEDAATSKGADASPPATGPDQAPPMRTPAAPEDAGETRQPAAQGIGALGDWGLLTPEDASAEAQKNFESTAAKLASARANLADAKKALADHDLITSSEKLSESPVVYSAYNHPNQRRAVLVDRLDGAQQAFNDAEAKQKLAEAIVSGKKPIPFETQWRSYLESGLQAAGENAIAAPVKFAGIIGGYLRRMPGPETDEFGTPFAQQNFPRPEPQDNAVYRAGERISEWMKQQFPADPARQYETGTKLAHMAGSLAALIGTKGVESLLAQGPRALAAAGKTLMPAVSAADSGVPGYEAATRAMTTNPNVGEDGRLKAFLLHSGLGLSSMLPVERIWGAPAARSAAGLFGGAAKSGALSAAQMASYSLASDAIAKAFYDPDRQIGATAGEDGALAFLLGLAGHGGAQLVKAIREGELAPVKGDPFGPKSAVPETPSRGQIDALGGRIDALRSDGTVAVDPQAMQRLMSELPVLRSNSEGDLRAFAAQSLGLPDAELSLRRIAAVGDPGNVGQTGASGASLFRVTDPGGNLLGVVKMYPQKQIHEMGGELLGMKTFEGMNLDMSARALGAGRLPDGAGVLMLSPGKGETIDSTMVRAGSAEQSAGRQAAMNELRAAVPKAADTLAGFHAAPSRPGAGHEAVMDHHRAYATSMADEINDLVAAFNRGKDKGRLDLDPNQLTGRVRDLAEGLRQNPGRAGFAHGDFQPGNIFYDKDTGRSTIIDSVRLPQSMDANGAAIGSSARDVTNFTHVLGVHGVKYHLTDREINELQQIFNDRYNEVARGPAMTPEAMRFFRARIALELFPNSLKESSRENVLTGASSGDTNAALPDQLTRQLRRFKEALDLQ